MQINRQEIQFALQNHNIWTTGRKHEPGIHVLNGPCNLSYVPDIPGDPSAIPNPSNPFEQCLEITLLVKCNKKLAKIPTSMTYAYVSPNGQQEIFSDGIDHLTSEFVTAVYPPEPSTLQHSTPKLYLQFNLVSNF